MKRKVSGLGVSLVLVIGMIAMTGCGTKVTIPDEYDYDLSEYIKLGEYKGLSYEAGSDAVSQGEIEEYIKSVLEQSKTTKTVTDGVVDESSIVDIDYEGYIDGVQFDGGTGSETLDIDNSSFIEGFAEGLIGHSVGENFDINVTFPEDYGSSELAGKPAVFKIKINSIQQDVLPEYNDDFVKNNTDFDNTKDYEADIKDKLKAEKERDNQKQAITDVFGQIVDASEVLKLPEKELNARSETILGNYTDAAAANGMEIEAYLQTTMGMSLDDFKAEVKKSAEDIVKRELVLHAIAELEGISISESEYGEYLDKLIEDAGYSKDSFKSENGISIEEYAVKNNLYSSCLHDKVMEKVMEYCEK